MRNSIPRCVSPPADVVPMEIAVVVNGQARRLRAVRAIGLAAEAVDDRLLPGFRCELEDRTLARRAAEGCGAVEFAVRVEEQRIGGPLAVGAIGLGAEGIDDLLRRSSRLWGSAGTRRLAPMRRPETVEP